MKEITMTFLTDYPGIRCEYTAFDQADRPITMRLEIKLGNPVIDIYQRPHGRRKWRKYSFMAPNVIPDEVNGKLTEGLLALSAALNSCAVGCPDESREVIPANLAETLAYEIEVRDVTEDSAWENIPYSFIRLPFHN